MEFNYARFTEEWATLYKPMHHVPGKDSTNRRFYICDSYTTMTDFLTRMDPDCSPCVIIESQQEGNIEAGNDYPRYSFYFMVRSGTTHDGYAALDSKSEAKRIMIDFLGFIRIFKENMNTLAMMHLPDGSYLAQLRDAVMAGDRCMENLNIESVVYDSLNEMYDTWYGVQMTLDDMQTFSLCADLSLYD